jgi:ribosomal silencing factor RsfS
VVHRDGLAGAEPDWVLLDYGDLMVHVFRPESRASYALEAYYAEARLLARWKND